MMLTGVVFRGDCDVGDDAGGGESGIGSCDDSY